ncbi:MAG: leucine-rich repeat protein [Bacteroidales bacterium]|jgi:uncharacterized repeat protein (TIGR02543 family)|nr:leucine-rich repeat protein [Bacteroidales bacterium]
MKKILFTLLFISSFTVLFSQVSETVNLATAGTLSSYSFTTPAALITDLTITGTINADDITFMKNSMTVLSVLDMSDAQFAVTEFPASAFFDKTSLTSVKLPANINSIGAHAFFYCSSMESIEFPEGLSFIDRYAFNNCRSLTSLEFPESLDSIGGYSFSNCTSLVSVDFSENLITIDEYAFSDCTSMISLSFHENLRSIGNQAFYFCSSLVSVDFSENLITIGNSAFEYCSSLISVNLPESLNSIGESAFSDCTSLTSVELFENLNSIGNFAFYGCFSLSKIINHNPAPITINKNVFYMFPIAKCSLIVSAGSAESYCSAAVWSDFPVIGEMYSIGEHKLIVKSNNFNYGSISVSSNSENSVILEAINDKGNFTNWIYGNFEEIVSTENPHSITLTSDTVITALFDPVYTTINLNEAGSLSAIENIKTVINLRITGNIDARDFQFMRDSIPKLVNLDIENVSIVEYSGTEGTCNSTDITYPANELPQRAFYNLQVPSLIHIKLPTTLENIGASAFYNSRALNSVIFPENLNTIKGWAFAYCYSLGSIKTPENLSTLENNAFYSCKSLASVELNENLSSIGDNAFDWCISLSTIKSHNPDPATITLGTNIFQNVNVADCNLIVPAASASAYSTAPVWEDFNVLEGYNISISVNNEDYGRIITNIGDIEAIVTVRAIANEGYIFVNWTVSAGQSKSDEIVSTENPFTFMLTDNTVLTANFAIKYTVELRSGSTEYGTVNGSGDYAENSEVEIEAIPNEGCAFINWTTSAPLSEGGEIVSTENPFIFTLINDTILIANFASTNAYLSDLTVSEGILAPAFDSETTNYTVNVANNISEIEIIATTSDINAELSGHTETQTLEYGENPFVITVTAEDGVTFKDYNIKVIRNSVEIMEILYDNADFYIYPNPVKDILNLNLENYHGEVTVQISNTLGIIIFEQKFAGGNIHTISLEDLPKGIYVVSINEKSNKIYKIE